MAVAAIPAAAVRAGRERVPLVRGGEGAEAEASGAERELAGPEGLAGQGPEVGQVLGKSWA